MFLTLFQRSLAPEETTRSQNHFCARPTFGGRAELQAVGWEYFYKKKLSTCALNQHALLERNGTVPRTTESGRTCKGRQIVRKPFGHICCQQQLINVLACTLDHNI